MASKDDSVFEQEGMTSPDYHIPPPNLTLLQRLLSRRPEETVEDMRTMFRISAKGLGRHLTQEEVDALCHIAYKEARTSVWALPVSAMLAAALAWRGRSTYRFPFVQPNFETFSPNVFPTAMAPFLQGRRANLMWHGTRYIAYFTLSSLFVAPFVRSYATSVAMMTARRDQRLSQYRKDMMPERLVKGQADTLSLPDLTRQRWLTAAALRKLEKELAALPTEEEVAAGSDDPDKTALLIQGRRFAANQGQKLIEEHRRILAHVDELIKKRSGGDGDDASAQNKDYEALSASSSSGDYFLPTEPNRAPPIGYSREPPSSEGRSGWGWGQKGSSSQQGSGSGSSSSSSSAFDDLEIDDASPLAPSARSQLSDQSSGNISAWDRIRRASKQPSRASGGAQAQQRGSDAYYTYDAVDKEKDAEKDKAQAEFDAMVERERRGDTGRGDERNGRW
ncbi:hypothetical protein LX36DRAFT_649268 [Colletotrichum falcatum]|nr:hypothetical protein LX36DRAFT_649268 [Colletotrichum falcatum]